jgi:quinolinate synthase
MTTASLSQSIEQQRKNLGSALTVVGHHYQAEEVIRHVDIRGDSLELARKVADVRSEYIMFCGVYFMAESAALLAREGQQVHLPEPSAECSMALMSPPDYVEGVLRTLMRGGRKVIPLTYVNSTLAVKAVVGRFGGSVCTSANARTMLEWALREGDAVLFLPDGNLGMNTADLLGIPESDRHQVDIRRKGEAVDTAKAEQARILLWPGFCSIHTYFTVAQVEAMRKAHPKAKIVVHPECTPDVVRACDDAGSTSYLIRYAAELPDGETLVIGTEINLVQRLAEQHRGRISILPLIESTCPHMAQTTESSLGEALDALQHSRETGRDCPFLVRVPEEFKAPAKAALERMLAICR